jgi:hypothetical protein
MKKILAFTLVLALTLIFTYGMAFAGNGNGLPPGPRYMLNVKAFDPDNCPAGDFTGSNRHMIAVQADFGDIDFDAGTTSNQAGTNKNAMIKANTIKLTEGDDFQVLDGNACSKGGAEFMLPADPYLCDKDGDGALDDEVINDPTCITEDLMFQEYRVFVRLVGRPGTGIGITTCADEATGYDVDLDTITSEDEILCSTESVVKIRMTGKGSMKFHDVTRELLTLCLDTLVDGNLDGNCDTRYALFDPALEDFFWQWNTHGKAHAQLVFIPYPD